MRVLYTESGNRALVGDIGSARRSIARQCIQEQETQEFNEGGNKTYTIMGNRVGT